MTGEKREIIKLASILSSKTARYRQLLQSNKYSSCVLQVTHQLNLLRREASEEAPPGSHSLTAQSITTFSLYPIVPGAVFFTSYPEFSLYDALHRSFCKRL